MTVAAISKTNEQVLCRPVCRRVAGAVNLQALNATFATLPKPFIFGGNDSGKGQEAFSYWAAKPRDLFEFTQGQKKPFEKLQAAINKYKIADFDKRVPEGLIIFGWAGYFGYELGEYIEKISAAGVDDIGLPLVRLLFYDRFIAYNHNDSCCRLVALQMNGDSEGPDEKLDKLERLLESSQERKISESCVEDFGDIVFSQVRSNMDKDYYLESVRKIKRHIFDGDVYQVNFSQRFECDYRGQAAGLFAWQNRHNPCGYSAFIDGGDFAIVSASPEMFLTIKDGIISTRPIKGTRPRVGGSNKNNEDNYRELLTSPKEQAELNMIIDLERNDLARICEPGTRRVTQGRTIEVHPTVFHAAATVEGRLRKDVNFCDVLRATFPGGSITGAPKVSAMEIIGRLEPVRRGVYTGSIGILGANGDASLNIAIRTIIIKGGKAFVQTGGGIVADSEPEAEWNETLVKARALLNGIKATDIAFSVER